MKTKILAGKDRGLTLVEALVAMTIFLITLGFMIPLLADNQLKTINREIETGAISISQRILDELRQEDIKTLPSSGTATALPSELDISSITERGKKYSAKIIYCESNTNCDQNTREIKVQVNYNGQEIYTVKTLYTQFE